MIVLALVAVALAAPPSDGPELRPAIGKPAAVHAPSPRPTRRAVAGRPDLPTPTLSPVVDPYRGGEASYDPRRFDPQHPSLAPLPVEPEGVGEGLGHVSPVPPDPWAATLAPPPPDGGTVRPPGGGG
jgi:hypothetical protein